MIRAALVGAGGMASAYRQLYGRCPNVEWALAVDTNPTELLACKALGVQRVATDFAEALKPDVDLVNISTPNHLHEEQAIAALKAGKHVLLEKPMTNTLEAADRLVAAAQAARGTFGMYMSSYTSPVVWEIKRMIQTGALGQIQSVRARDAHRGGLSAQKTAWRGDRQQTGGGCFIQLSVHSINLVQWWLGSRISEVSAYSANQFCPNVGGDDVTHAITRFGSGAFGSFESGWASHGGLREIYGTKGYVRLVRGTGLELELDESYDGQVIKYSTPKKLARLEVPERSLDDLNNPHNQHRMFVACLLAGKRPHMNAEDGRQDVAVVAAAYRSAESGRAEKVE